MRQRPRGRAAFLAAAALSLVACTSLFGIEQGTLVDAGADSAATAEGAAPAETGGSDVAHDTTSGTEGGDALPDQTSGGDGPQGSETSADHTTPESGADVTVDGPGTDGPTSDGPPGTDGPPPQGDAGVGKVGTLGDACGSPGATACNGNDSQVVLICQSGAWAASGTCPSTQRCDSTVGACANVAAACTGSQPGDEVCASGNVVECGVDLTSTSPVAICGPHQTCTVSGSTASCICNADPSCTVAGGVCTSSTTLVTCTQDGSGCLYTSATATCTNGACSGAAGSGACCTNDSGCTGASQTCSGPDVLVCALGSDGCYHGTTSACATDYTCISDRCQCSGNSCQGNQDGNICLFDSSAGFSLCGCNTSADCQNGGCCNTMQSRILCYPNGSGFGTLTCTNGVYH